MYYYLYSHEDSGAAITAPCDTTKSLLRPFCFSNSTVCSVIRELGIRGAHVITGTAAIASNLIITPLPIFTWLFCPTRYETSTP